MTVLTDEQLMGQLQQGNAGALDELYRRHARGLHAFCRNLAPSSHDPEDLVQDVFERVIKSTHSFDPQRASFRTWLYGIARNRRIDVARRASLIRFLPIGRRAEGDERREERHAYVYQLTSSGSLVQLFPNPAYSAVPNPLLPGQLTMLPAEPNWLYLDGSPGEERLYVVASPQPLQDLDDLYAQYIQGPDAASKRELLSDLLDMLEAIAQTHPERADAVEFVFQHR